MAWYDEAVFYHIYPLGLCGAPAQNDYGEPVHRLESLIPWIGHIRSLGCSGLYIGPLFQSVGHGYETSDYYTLDSRLGNNDDLRRFVARCHEAGLRVILDGVFNHTGRDFFAFRDLREHREQSPYRDWYCGVDFWGDNGYHDGFRYETWGGYELLAKLNLRNPQVQDYLLDAVAFWVRSFDIDGLRLDTADLLDFGFLQRLRQRTAALKSDFWLMGEVIHGDYSRWVNAQTLHSVTNYALHKALYSGHNDHNYFEIAHTVKRQLDMGLGGTLLYNFVDNHDVERIYSKLNDKRHYLPVHVLLYTLPGIPSLYYGSEYGIEGRKERGSDASLRPCLDLAALEAQGGACRELIAALGALRQSQPELRWGAYRQLQLTTTQYAFARGALLITVNNADSPAAFRLPGQGAYLGALSGQRLCAADGFLCPELAGCGAEIWIPEDRPAPACAPLQQRPEAAPAPSAAPAAPPRRAVGKAPEEMSVEELQAEILARLSANGPLTDRMRREVRENVYRDSLLNWLRSFR